MPATTATIVKESNDNHNHAISTTNIIVAKITKTPLHSAPATEDTTNLPRVTKLPL
jgi:hypothetical protein